MIARQTGATLIVALLILVLMTLLSINAFQFGRTNLAVTANSQFRSEALGYAKDATAMVMSSTAFFKTPNSALPANAYSACSETNRYCGDVNGDGTIDYRVDLTPQPYCKSALNIQNAQLNLALADDLGCVVSSSQDFGISGAASGASLCADSLWEITSVSSSSATGASVILRTGVKVRVSVDNIATSCP